MDLLTIYYAGTPILLCNLLFYSITTLSNSISSSQNVFKFISEHVEPDYIIFKHTIEKLDLENKIKILNSLIFDVIEKYGINVDEFNRAQNNSNHHEITCHEDDFLVVSLNSSEINTLLNKIDDPIKRLIISLSETIYDIHVLMNETNDKINNHKKSFIKNIITLILKDEISKLNKLSNLLDVRCDLFINLLKIYLTKF
jgi:hypothetical protein